MIEALRTYRRYLGEAVLDLVGNRERGQERAAVGVRVFGGGEHRREVVARVAGLPWRQVGVVEVQVANERPVVESRAIGRAPSPADQGCQRRSAELLQLLADHRHRLAVQRTERHAQRVQHPQLELLTSRLGDVLPTRTAHEPREPLDPGRTPIARSFAHVLDFSHV